MPPVIRDGYLVRLAASLLSTIVQIRLRVYKPGLLSSSIKMSATVERLLAAHLVVVCEVMRYYWRPCSPSVWLHWRHRLAIAARHGHVIILVVRGLISILFLAVRSMVATWLGILIAKLILWQLVVTRCGMMLDRIMIAVHGLVTKGHIVRF